MTIKETLLRRGMQENEFASHKRDLYVLKTEVSAAWLAEYGNDEEVAVSVWDEEGIEWFEIPYGYVKEFTAAGM